MAMHDNPEKYEEIPAHLSKISDLPSDVFLDPCFGAPSEWPYYNGRPLPPDPKIPKALLRSTRMEKEQFDALKVSIAHDQQLLNLKSAQTMKLVRKRKSAIRRKKKRIMKGIDSSTFSPSHMRYWNDITMIYANRSKKVIAKDAAREKSDRESTLVEAAPLCPALPRSAPLCPALPRSALLCPALRQRQARTRVAPPPPPPHTFRPNTTNHIQETIGSQHDGHRSNVSPRS